MHDDPAGLAYRQWRDYQARTPGTIFADPELSLDLAGAYQLQDAVRRLRTAAGDRVVGYKVGCTGPGTTAQFGMAGPIRGCLFESELHRSGVTLAAESFAGLAIEGEMALRIGDDGRPGATFPVIELHNFVFRWPKKTLVELVANNGLNAGVVLPPEICMDMRVSPENAATLEVRISGRLVGAGGPWPHTDGADASMDWLRSHLQDWGLTLAPGHLVLAGTALGLYPVKPGDHVVVSLDGVPMTECLIA